MPRTIDPDELRNRFRAAQRMPQLLEVHDLVRTAVRQTSDEWTIPTAAIAAPSSTHCLRG